jgi:hypothetical protein
MPWSLRIALAATLVGMGWVAGTAQTREPDFEIVVNAPEGATTIQCLRGCALAYVERGANPRSTPMPTFKFECKGASDLRCSSRKVGGWVKP